MTFAFHHYSGTVLGILIARLFGWDPWIWGLFGFIVGGFPDTASWVMYKVAKWDRWRLYNYCHPPYVPETGSGSWDRIFKWIPFWGQHTWLWDSIVHPTAPRWLFPKFDAEWANIVWIRLWPAHKNIQITKWWVLYVLLEVSLWVGYTALLFI